MSSVPWSTALRPSPLRFQALLLDAGGTLFEERVPREQIYCEAARRRGLEVGPPEMRERMYRIHAELHLRESGHFRYSEGWFRTFNERLLCGLLGLPRSDLAEACRELAARFADPATFRLLPGAQELLATARERGLRVGVVSNWSERLPEVLAGLGLGPGLDFVLCSAVEECEKPGAEIFRRALARAGAAAERTVHAGNDPDKDVRGAAAVGILPVLVGPAGASGAQHLTDLRELERWIVQRT